MKNDQMYKLQGWGPTGDYAMVTGPLTQVVNQAMSLSQRLDMEVVITRRWSGQPVGARANKLPLPGKLGK